jgi:hypothetical protein
MYEPARTRAVLTIISQPRAPPCHMSRGRYILNIEGHTSRSSFVFLFFPSHCVARVSVEVMNAAMSSSAESDAELLIHMNNVYLRNSFTSPFSPSYDSGESSS